MQAHSRLVLKLGIFAPGAKTPHFENGTEDVSGGGSSPKATGERGGGGWRGGCEGWGRRFAQQSPAQNLSQSRMSVTKTPCFESCEDKGPPLAKRSEEGGYPVAPLRGTVTTRGEVGGISKAGGGASAPSAEGTEGFHTPALGGTPRVPEDWTLPYRHDHRKFSQTTVPLRNSPTLRTGQGRVMSTWEGESRPRASDPLCVPE